MTNPARQATEPSRRNFLKGVAAVGAGSLLATGELPAQTPAAATTRAIDCHFHYGSPGYAKALAARIGRPMAGFGMVTEDDVRPWRDYSAAKAVEFLDHNDLAAAVLSATSPGTWFGDPAETRSLARDLNDYAAKMRSDYPRRFAFLASLPLPNADDCLKEIEYALDTLHADGISILSSYEEHYWLGDPIFHPVFDELNRRKAVVCVHPAKPFQTLNHVGITEFLTDTMRTLYSLLTTGAATRYGDIRFLFSHAGGTMPSYIERFKIAEPGGLDEALAREPEPNSNLFHLRRFYYDVAQSCNSVQLQALKTIAGTSQMVFGSDWPMIQTSDPANAGSRQIKGLEKCHLDAAEMAAIRGGNAERLFQRLKL
jgi:predicted TIM-barrel fold metal-dependent hydrolase